NSSYITSLYEDPYHYFWVGTRNGLNLFDRTDGSFIPISLKQSKDKKYTVTAIASADNHLWIGTGAGDLFELGFSLKEMNTLTRQKNEAPALVSDIAHIKLSGSIHSFCVFNDVLWIGTDSGVRQLKL